MNTTQNMIFSIGASLIIYEVKILIGIESADDSEAVLNQQ